MVRFQPPDRGAAFCSKLQAFYNQSLTTMLQEPVYGDLTPAKIVLSILTVDYLDKKLPRSRYFLSFIATHIELVASSADNNVQHVSSLEDFMKSLCNFYPNDSRHSAFNDPNLIGKQLEQNLSKIKGPDELYQWSRDMVKRLTHAQDHDRNFNLIESSRGLTGRFLKGFCLTIQLLGFAEYDLLYSSFNQFIHNQAKANREIIPKNMRGIGFTPLSVSWNGNFESIIPSDLEDLTRTQSEMIQSVGVPIPSAFKKALDAYALQASSSVHNGCLYEPNGSSHLASYHYLRYLKLLGEGEYHASFDALHQHFDYMVSKGSKRYYHYALVAKASLHLIFGEEDNAICTIEEAGNVAREHRDEAALTYVLTWLHKVLGNSVSHENLTRTKRIKNSRLLEFLTLINFERESLLAASILQLEFEEIVKNGASPKRSYQTMSKSLFCSLCGNSNALGKIARVSSRHWLRSGYPILAKVYVEVLAFSPRLKLADEPEELTKALCDLFYWQGDMGKLLQNINTLSKSSVLTRLTLRSASPWRLIYMIKLFIRNCEFRIAKELLDVLHASSSRDVVTKGEIIRLEVLLMSSTKNSMEALRVLEGWITAYESLSKAISPIDIITCYLIKSDLLIKAGRFGSSFVLILEQIKKASKYGLFVSVVILAVKLVAIFHACHDKRMAIELSMAIVPTLHRSNNATLISEIYLQLAEKYIHPHSDSMQNKLSNNLQHSNSSSRITGYADINHMKLSGSMSSVAKTLNRHDFLPESETDNEGEKNLT